MSARLGEIRRIFGAVFELPEAERAGVLDRLCAGDAMLRREVETLLRSHQTDGFMSAPTVVSPEGAGERPGTIIGVYKLLQMIGEGGFGVVYMAEQERPVRRKVALKIIKLGMDTRQVIARFEAERQALAMMDHPNIARVLDAGSTETGRPYFVMELVRGVPITEYCDTNKLTPRDRLDLFIQVCHAVQHAHQKGVIHRDIKPSNVLVTLHDGRPVPKVIDFGIAKATSQRLTDKTLFTEFRQFIGTPEYMSPEQAEMSGLDVDTRSDIYSLGVLLYELLTGTTPFDGRELRGQALDRIQKMIREAEPPRPSTRVDTLAATTTPVSTSSLADVARQRRTDPAALGRLLRGDLDWIVMRSIEKDRTRRYETATALAADVQRFLDDEPVEAGPPSASYRMRKFVKRNRAWLVPGAAGAALLALSFVAIVIGFIEASRGQAAAIASREEAEVARAQATAALDQARLESDRNRQVSEFLQDAVSARRTRDGRTTPIGLDEVLEQGRSIFGGDHAIVGNALLGWASARQISGDAAGAEPAIREAAELFARLGGQNDAQASNARLQLARAISAQPGRESEAESLFRDVVEATRRDPGPGSAEHAVAAEALASHIVARGGTVREDEAARLWKDAIAAAEAAYGPLDFRTIREMCSLGQWLQVRGRKDEARPILVEAIGRGEGVLPAGDLAIYFAINSMILLEWTQNSNWADAAVWYDKLIARGNAMGGEFARSGVSMLLQVAGFHTKAGRHDVAIRRLEEYLAAQARPGYQPDWNCIVRVETSIEWLAEVLEANPDLGRRVQIARARGADRSVAVLTTTPGAILESCSEWLTTHGFFADAEGLLVRAVALRREGAPTGGADLGRALGALGACRLRLERWEDAEAPLREALSIGEAVHGPQDSRTLRVRIHLAECMLGRNRIEDARRLLLDVVPGPGSSRELVAEHAALLERLEAGRPG